MTMVSFRTDKALKEQASKIYESLGLNQHKYPCSLELDAALDAKSTYEPGFFALFGQGADLGFDEEPEDVPPEDVSL